MSSDKTIETAIAQTITEVAPSAPDKNFSMQFSLANIYTLSSSKVSWDDLMKDDPNDAVKGLGRWSTILMAGSRHFGARTFPVQTENIIENPFASLQDNLPEGVSLPESITITTQEDVPFNEFNPGVGAEYRLNETFHAAAGVYKNSINGISTYIAVGAETNRDKFFGAGLEVGALTGYWKDVVPSAFPYVRLGTEDQILNAHIGGIPAIEDVTPAVVALRLRINLEPVFDGPK